MDWPHVLRKELTVKTYFPPHHVLRGDDALAWYHSLIIILKCDEVNSKLVQNCL